MPNCRLKSIYYYYFDFWHLICLYKSDFPNFIVYLKEKFMAEDNSTGSNFIWAVALIIIVAIIAGALYYSGFLGGTKKERIDINVTAPATR
jgi:hypothetical protein